MGGGILPIAKKNGNYYVLLARETVDLNWKDAGKWSDFGGSKENNETEYETAIREGAEETSGVYGKEKNIKYLIDNYTEYVVNLHNYSTYLIRVNYNSLLPYQFNQKYREALKKTPEIVYEHNGLYEKDKIRWVDVNNLKIFSEYSRFWFKPVMIEIYNKFNTLNNNKKNF